jgi:hypothetical protein
VNDVVSPVQARVSTWVLFVASLLTTGCDAIGENHAVQIPLVNWLNDPSLYPHDPFMIVLARYPSALWPLVALGARLLPLEGLLLTLVILERFFVLYAAGRLARAFAPRSWLAVVAATGLFAFAVQPVLGSGTIVESYFEQTGLAIAFLLLAAAAFQESRPIAWAVWLAAAFDVNAMYGVFALSYFGAAFALDPDHRRTWTMWIRPFSLLIVLATPALYFVLRTGSMSPSNEALWRVAADARCWIHVYPRYWSAWDFVRFGVLVVLAWAVLRAAKRSRPRLFGDGMVWSIVACLWVLASFAAAYVVKSPRLMMLQSARATDVWICLAMIAVVSVAALRIEESTDSRTRLRWTIALLLAFLPWLPPGAWAVAALVLIAALPPLSRGLARWSSPRRLAWLLVAWVCLAGMAAARARVLDPSGLAGLLTSDLDPSVRRIAAWARANTAIDSTFLVDPSDKTDFEQFMGLARRSIFTNWEEGTALYWAPDFVQEWTQRLRALGCDLARPSALEPQAQLFQIYWKLNDDDVALLKQRYRLSYWVAPGAHRSRFPVAFRTSGYQVLDVR